MRSIVRRDTGESYQAYLTRLAEARASDATREASGAAGSEAEEEDIQ